MARMHSRKRGNAGSTKPATPNMTWVRYNEKEIEMLITKLAKEEKTASEIGIILRDSYGIPSVKAKTKRSIGKILNEKKLSPKLPFDLTSLMRKSIALRKHLEANHKDEGARRGLLLTESKIKRLIKYYKRSGKIEETWKYEPKKIRLLLE